MIHIMNPPLNFSCLIIASREQSDFILISNDLLFLLSKVFSNLFIQRRQLFFISFWMIQFSIIWENHTLDYVFVIYVESLNSCIETDAFCFMINSEYLNFGAQEDIIYITGTFFFTYGCN